MKKCPLCKMEKSLDDFFKNPGTLDKRGSYCKQCDNKKRREQRREVKARLVKHFGGACVRCGYSKSVAAMDFHHVGDKDFEISRSGDFEKSLKEASKCKLVCANCHRELHEIERET